MHDSRSSIDTNLTGRPRLPASAAACFQQLIGEVHDRSRLCGCNRLTRSASNIDEPWRLWLRLRVPRCASSPSFLATRDYLKRATARPAFVKAHADQIAHFAEADTGASS
jgi:hypothetical protein